MSSQENSPSLTASQCRTPPRVSGEGGGSGSGAGDDPAKESEKQATRREDRRKTPVPEWDVEQVCAWACENNLSEFEAVARSEDIDGCVLFSLDDKDTRSEPLASSLRAAGLLKFGQLRRLDLALAKVRQEEQEATAAAECKHTATAAAAAKPPLLLLQQHHPSLDALNTKASDAILPPHLRSCHVCGGGGTPDGLTPTNSVQHLSVYADELGAGRGGWLGAVGGAGMGGHGTPVVYVATAHEPQQQRPLAGGAWAAGGDVTPRLRERSSSSTQQCGDAGKGLCSHSPESFMAKGLEWRMASSELGLNKGGGARGKRSWREGTSREEREREEREEPMPSAIVRLLLSVVWAMGVVCTSAGVMTFVHDRVPDMQKYPPLPDIVLDHIPLIPWAFEASEVCIAMLALLFFFTVIFHRHRLQVLRRFFAIIGSVFLLRCCTMLVTSLSVPGEHLKCQPFPPHMTSHDKLWHAWTIASTLGSALSGTRTCGDYMFSGHTAVLTILNRFVVTYTKDTWHTLHNLCHILNGFGMFFILAAHEHYTLDVLMGFYITTRTFQSYHAVANSVPACDATRSRTRKWFPMVSFLEEHTAGVLPNDFQIPFGDTLGQALKGKEAVWKREMSSSRDADACGGNGGGNGGGGRCAMSQTGSESPSHSRSTTPRFGYTDPMPYSMSMATAHGLSLRDHDKYFREGSMDRDTLHLHRD